MSDVEVRRLPIQHLERKRFEPFGAVIGPETADSPNLNRAPGPPGLSVGAKRLWSFPSRPTCARCATTRRGTRVEFLQKHPDSTVTFIPLGGRASAIVVAPDDGHDHPDIGRAAAFLLDGSKGVVMHRGTWMRYAYPLGEFADFAYVTQRVDPATANTTDDTVRVNLDTQFGFVFDLVFEVPRGPSFEHGPSGAITAGPPRNPPYE